MNVRDVPVREVLIASSDFDEKLVTRLTPAAAASCVTFTVLSTAPVVLLTFCRVISAVMPKFASTRSLFQTFAEQLALVQNALLFVATIPPLLGSGAPAANPGSEYVAELTIR